MKKNEAKVLGLAVEHQNGGRDVSLGALVRRGVILLDLVHLHAAALARHGWTLEHSGRLRVELDMLRMLVAAQVEKRMRAKAAVNAQHAALKSLGAFRKRLRRAFRLARLGALTTESLSDFGDAAAKRTPSDALAWTTRMLARIGELDALLYPTLLAVRPSEALAALAQALQSAASAHHSAGAAARRAVDKTRRQRARMNVLIQQVGLVARLAFEGQPGVVVEFTQPHFPQHGAANDDETAKDQASSAA